MTQHVDAMPWADADEAHWQVMQRAAGLPSEQAIRECRDLLLLSSAATAASLTFFALSIGASAGATFGLAAITVGMAGLTARIFRRDYGLTWTDGASRSPRKRWRTPTFRLFPGRHECRAGVASREKAPAPRRSV